MAIKAPMSVRHEVVERELDAFDRQDWETMKSCLTLDMVDVEPGGLELQGRDAVVEGLKFYKVAMPDLTHKLTRVIEAPDGIAVEIVWHGTHTGPLTTPTRTIPATGKPVKVEAAGLFTFEGDLIKEFRHYWNQMDLLTAIGAVPSAG